MLDISAQEGILRGSGVILFGVFLLYGLGITWSCLLSITFWALYVTITRMADDSFDEGQSIENLQTSNDPTSRKKRILAKKRGKHYKKRSQPATDTEDEDDLDTGLKRSQELADENMYGSIDYEAAAAYHGVFAMPSSGSKKLSRRHIPSLKSPQPLLSAFHSRISRREYNAMSPTILSNRNYPLSPRSVFDNVHNRNISSPINRRMAAEPFNIFKEQSFDAHRALSPPSGRYFSRIQPNFPQDSRSTFEITNKSFARKDKTMENQIQTEKLDDSCSKEAIIKVLQEKTANKRKRIWPDVADTPTVFQDKSSKKRRIDDNFVDKAVMETKQHRLTSNERTDLSKTQEGHAQPTDASSHAPESGSKENKERDVEQKNKYGLGDNEMELLADEENMENENAQSKRKIEPGNEAPKGKKAREDVANDSRKKDARRTPLSQNETKKKATPVRSIETQTPTGFGETDDVTKSPRALNVLKTPYKKVFVSGFPSNLKPDSTEKRRKVPIYSGSFKYNENIEIGLEEYGSLGVTSAAYTADKKAAMDRVMSLLNRSGDDDDDDDNKEGKKENASTSLPTSISAGEPVVITQTHSISSIPASTTVPSPAVSSQTAPSILPTVAISVSPFSASQKAIDVAKSSSQKSDGSSLTSSSKPVAVATGILSNSQLNSNTTDPQEKVAPFSFGLQSALSTKTTTIVTSSETSSALFGNPQQNSNAFGGFNFGSQPSSSAPIASSSATSISFGKSVNTTETTQASQALKVSNEPASLPQPSQPSVSGFGGFNFGTSIASNHSSKSQTNSSTAITKSSVEVANPAIGFSFGLSSLTQKQPMTENRTQTTSEASVSSTISTMPKVGGFSFGTTVTTSSQTLPSSTFGGFNFGTNPTTVNGNGAVSSLKTTIADLKFGATSSTQSFGGFSFASTFPSQAPKVDSVSTNFGAKIQTGVTTSSSTASIFNAPSANLQSTFGSKPTPSSTIAANLFGAPTKSVAFGSQPQLGTGQSIASGQLFAKPSSVQATPLFGVSTQNSAGVAPTFGPPPQTSSTVGSFFAAPTLGTNANAPLFNAVSQASSSSAPVFGASTQNTGSVFNAPSQSSQQSSLLFGTPQKSTAAPAFATQAPANSFSFGSNQNTPLFGGAAKTTAASIGGFSFASNSQAAAPSNKPVTQFGQSGSNAFGQFGAQAGSGSHPFANVSVFGQAPAAVTTTPGFSFGTASAPAFGQTNSGQRSFGAAAPATFQPVVNQPQTGGFNFAAVAGQKPVSFSFGGGASSGGFTSRPGTPTPFSNPQGPAADIFTSPQPQNVGFAMGSGNGTSNRPTVRGRRRTRFKN